MPPMDNLTALALVLAAAVVAGLAMNRARLPAAAGFILTGVLLGPTGFGVVARSDSIETLADLGVLLLLFIIGMELRLAAFRKLLPLACAIAAAEIAIFTGFTVALAPHAPSDALAFAGVKLLLAVALLAGFIVLLTRIKSFRFPASSFLMKDIDVGTLGVLAVCFVAAAASGLLGLSPALGAFLAGLAVGHSTLRRTALVLAQPVQSILLFIFFLSIGLLIDLSYVLHHLWLIAIVLAVVTVGK